MKQIFIFATLILCINALSEYEQWTEFKAKHSRQYELQEHKLRFQIFQKNFRKIEEHNAKYEKGEVSYFLTTTKFADWTDQEFKAILDADDVALPKFEQPRQESLSNFADHPESLDWREKNAVTGVKDQGSCNSGYAFAAAQSIEGQLVIKKKVDAVVSLSEQELIDCTTVVGNQGCNGGFAEYTYPYCQGAGLSSEEQYPLTGDTATCYGRNITNKPLDSLMNFVTIAQTEKDLLGFTDDIGPIAIRVVADDWKLYGGGIYDNDDCGNKVNHGALNVGYGNDGKDFWIIKNSWGENWGEKGYIRLVRGKKQCGVHLGGSFPLLYS